MADEKVTLEELTVSTLAMADALSKLCIAKGLFTKEEFKAQLLAAGGQLHRPAKAATLTQC